MPCAGVVSRTRGLRRMSASCPSRMSSRSSRVTDGEPAHRGRQTWCAPKSATSPVGRVIDCGGSATLRVGRESCAPVWATPAEPGAPAGRRPGWTACPCHAVSHGPKATRTSELASMTFYGGKGFASVSRPDTLGTRLRATFRGGQGYSRSHGAGRPLLALLGALLARRPARARAARAPLAASGPRPRPRGRDRVPAARLHPACPRHLLPSARMRYPSRAIGLSFLTASLLTACGGGGGGGGGTPPPVDPVLSSLTVTPGFGTGADGLATAQITLVLADATGAPLPGRRV